MEDNVPFASSAYFAALGILVFARGMDFLSTWVATPNLMLEGNPIAKKLGWKWGAVVNALFCGTFAVWPLPAVVISTTSVLVAARNFQLAWMMRTSGEANYRAWFSERLEETPPSLFLFCLFAQTVLTGLVGGALILFSRVDQWISLGIGMGILGYAIAVLFFYVIVALARQTGSATPVTERGCPHRSSIKLSSAMKVCKRVYYPNCCARGHRRALN